jgi:hypothetical protein
MRFARTITLGAIVAAGIGGAAQPAAAQEATGACTAITALPLTISAPGRYCLTRSLAYTGTSPAIMINASAVTVDLGGHVIDGSRMPATSTAPAVYAGSGEGHTVRNGTVLGFGSGLLLMTGAATVERMQVFGAKMTGITLGSGSVRDCTVRMSPASSGVWAISVKNGNATIVRNDVALQFASTTLVGVGAIVAGGPARVEDNVVGTTNSAAAGVWIGGGIARGNVVHGFREGIVCTGNVGAVDSNAVFSATTPYGPTCKRIGTNNTP